MHPRSLDLQYDDEDEDVYEDDDEEEDEDGEDEEEGEDPGWFV